MKNLKSTIKNIEQTMGIRKWNKDLEESQDGESTGLNTLTEEWGLKIQHHGILLRSQPKDSWDFRRISDIKTLSYCMPWIDGA